MSSKIGLNYLASLYIYSILVKDKNECMYVFYSVLTTSLDELYMYCVLFRFHCPNLSSFYMKTIIYERFTIDI